MISQRARTFFENWKDKGQEKAETQKFWLEFLHDIFGVQDTTKEIYFEKPAGTEQKGYIDAYIPSSRTIIEQKNRFTNLKAPAKQSDGTLATPFEQAKRYYDWLPISEKGRYIVVCNFQEFQIYDMDKPGEQPVIVQLSSLPREWPKLLFLVNVNATSPRDIREIVLSVKAGQLVGGLYDSILELCKNQNDKHVQRSLNIFCVRIVFLLYAEDAGMLDKSQFHNYLKKHSVNSLEALLKLFDVLNQNPKKRDSNIDEDLEDFPYIDGGLFAERGLELPVLDGEPIRIILEEMSEGFDWSEISPTIFGAVFESTLNPKTRHSGGMHYTSIENIHKVIDPLFMDDLNDEFKTIMSESASRSRTQKLRAFQKKLSTLKFFDPACGSGNFLTETYLSLRRLENKILKELSKQILFADSRADTTIQVSISQFFGIEINDFAASVARTALWISEAQMWMETRSIVHFYGKLLPLKTYNNIHETNALRTDWRSIVKPSEKLYIMGNPPFLGYSLQNREQKEDLLSVFCDESGKPYRAAGKIDYIAAWYFKASQFITGTRARAAFVSTNSITQGEQVSTIFKTLSERFGIHIDFAHQSFVWDSESEKKARVHVVVIGFNARRKEEKERLKRLYTPEGLKLVPNINFYLMAAPNVFAESRQNAICKEAPEMMTGNRAADGGHLIIEAKDYKNFIKRAPGAKKFIKRYMMGNEFLNSKIRYCLWLVDATPQQVFDMKPILKRVTLCKEDRLKGAPDRQKLADSPTLFRETLNPKRYLAIPTTSSERRYYIPMGFLDDSVIPGDGMRIIPDADLYHFGVLTSRIHMAWVRAVTGRLEMRYSYSKQIDYNCFVWPQPTEEQRTKIEKTARRILKVRKLYSENTLASLYNDSTMPRLLAIAHKENDEAVCEAYGWPADISESEITARLFVMYRDMLQEKL